MKILWLLLFFIGLSRASNGQVRADSLLHGLTASSQESTIDSLQQSVKHLPDSIFPSLQSLDSIRNDFTLEVHNIQQEYQHVVAQIDAQGQALNNTVDSLRKLNLPAGKYTRKIDSLQRLKTNFESKYRSRFDSLKSKTIGRLLSVDLPPEYKEPLQKFTKSITGLNINTDIRKIQSIEIQGYPLAPMDGLDGLTSKAGRIGNIEDFGNLPEVETPIGDLGKVDNKAGAYQEDLANITQGNMQAVDKLPESIEHQAARIDGVEELQKQSAMMEKHQAQLGKLADHRDAKEKAVAMAKEKAVDHFAGKEEQLKTAMDKLSKYKEKYSSASSIRDLPKRPPNPMKGKPFIERLVPGLYFQYQQKTYYLLDANPYLGYKISGRFIAGAGWNHRLSYDRKYERWNQRSRIFGPRAYVDFKLGKGFIAHLEGESMNSFVPSTIHGNQDAGERQWVWSFMTGLKKEYKIYKNLKGTALIQYNLFNRYYKAPYVDRVNSRIGFEYILKSNGKKK